MYEGLSLYTEMNLTSADLEVMSNEVIMNSGRVSVESSRSQQFMHNNPHNTLDSTTSRSQPSYNTQRRFARSDPWKEIEELKKRVQSLEDAVGERDRLV